MRSFGKRYVEREYDGRYHLVEATEHNQLDDPLQPHLFGQGILCILRNRLPFEHTFDHGERHLLRPCQPVGLLLLPELLYHGLGDAGLSGRRHVLDPLVSRAQSTSRS